MNERLVVAGNSSNNRVPIAQPQREDESSAWSQGAVELIDALHRKLNDAHTDPDQRANTSTNNDLMLIDINRMILDFIHAPSRKTVTYSSDFEEDDPPAFFRN